MTNPPQALNCPSCGAPVAPDATSCGHCNSRLAMVACPSCFAMVIVGAKFCSHCGAAIARETIPATQKAPCPRCRVGMESVLIGNTNLRECPLCQGIWADTASLQHICVDREQQAAVLGVARSLPTDTGKLENVRYVPCPACNKLMNRVAFAHCSRVVVDVCKQHGTWFDKDELRRIVEFIRAGGLEAARAQEISELERKRQELRAAQIVAPMDVMNTRPAAYDGRRGGIASAAANLITGFFFD